MQHSFRTEKDLILQERFKEFLLKRAGIQVPVLEIIDPDLRKHIKERNDLIEQEQKMSFSYDLEGTLTEDEHKVDFILKHLRNDLKTDYYNSIIHNYHEEKGKLFESDLYKVFELMPKGAIHNCHLDGSVSADTLLKLTYNERVMFSQRDKQFRITNNHESLPDGFLPCQEMRKFWGSGIKFDNHLRKNFVLEKEDVVNMSEMEIQNAFNEKKTAIESFIKDKEFFSEIVHEILSQAAKSNITIVELRYTIGQLKNANQEQVPLKDELEILKHIINHIKDDHPHFNLRIIATMQEGISDSNTIDYQKLVINAANHSNFIAGLDYNGSIQSNEENLRTSLLLIKGNEQLGLYLSQGDLKKDHSQILADSIIIGCKRICHGLSLALNPVLTQRIIETQTCIEVCPLSNIILGKTHDFRNNPIRFLLSKGLQISISAGYHGIFDYKDVSIDYLVAFVGWELSLRDIKKCVINGITHCSLSEEGKKTIIEEVFVKQWKDFIEQVLEKYNYTQF